MTERTLVQAAQAGLPDAADELVERYYSRVYSFVATFRAHDAEDLTQEVFARALVALPRFNGEYQFGAWLLQIARNVCIDEARRQVRRPQPTDPTDLVELETVAAAKPDDVWESVSSQIAVTTVHRALAKLPARQRTALVLRELEGMSYADIAIALRISTRAVEVSLARARKRLRVELQQIDLAEEEMAACRRAASMMASGGAVSSEEVAEHVRTCTICQGMARKRRPRQVMHGAVGLLLAGSGHAAAALRRQAAWAQTLAHNVLSSSAAASVSPMARLAEIGASVAVATAVSAGSLAGPANAQRVVLPPTRPIPLTAPPALPAPAPAQPVVPAAQPQAVVPADHTAGPQVPKPSDASTCLAGAGTSAAQSSAAGASGNLIAEMLTPVNALSPLLACNPALAPVSQVVGGVVGGLQGVAGTLVPASSGSTQGDNLLQAVLGGGAQPAH